LKHARKNNTSASFTKSSLRPPSQRQIILFLTGTAFLSGILQIYILRETKGTSSLAYLPLMMVPGLVALACSKFFGNNFRDLGLLVKPGRLSMLYAYAIPAACAVLTLIVLLAMDIGKFKWPEHSIVRVLLFQPIFGVLVTFIFALGEEIGWRGYLHTHLMRARIPEPMIVTGLIWAMWHWPLILWGGYATSSLPTLSAALFTVMVTSFSVILGWLREYSKSVYPCALAHAVHNAWIQSIYPSFYVPGRMDPFFGGESGFVLAIIYLLIALYLYRTKIAASNY